MELNIFNFQGETVLTLVDQRQEPGAHEV